MSENQQLQKPESAPIAPATQTAVATLPARKEIRTVEDKSDIAYLMDTARFEHCYRIAGAMARASLIPKHLKGDGFEQTQANCFLVVNQALRWQLDPFSVAPETYEVGGKLGFQGKLIAAVINARGGLAEKLSYKFNDLKGDALEITVSGRLKGEKDPRTVKVSVGQAKTPNQMWSKDPEQKLVYTGAIRWARRHKPEIILGVLTDDDLDAVREEQRLAAMKPAMVASGGLVDVKSADQQEAPPEKPAKVEPPTNEIKDGLAIKVIEGGFTLDQFKKWLVASNQDIKDIDAIASFEDIPEANAKRYVTGIRTILKSLAEIKRTEANLL